MKLFHYDFVLKKRIPTEVKGNSVAKFVVFESFNLRNIKYIMEIKGGEGG